jgi:hypothetical protein
MSFGGSVSAMISSIKNNTRSKRKTYFDRDNSNSRKGLNSKRNKLLDKKASPELLAKIKSEMIEESRRTKIKNRIIIILSILVTILIFLFIQIKYMDSLRKFLP